VDGGRADAPQVTEGHPRVTETITNKVHTIKFDREEKVDLLDFALSHPNCVLRPKCKWRCTNYQPRFTVNMFRGNKWVLATKMDDTGEVARAVEKTFGEIPAEINVENKTMIFRIDSHLNLEDLYDYLYVTKGAAEGLQYLNKERYPAIICNINNTRKTILEIYHKGTINATGMKTPRDVQDVRDYIKFRILEFLKINQVLQT
jgi:TATA-box binding protein (TBP) (component of TFIID and TFIIIB)